MLEPGERTLFLTSLRPPEGFAFDRAISTTYSLDLQTLIVLPLAFTLFDWRRANGDLVGGSAESGKDPLTLLESLRRAAKRMHIFVESGRIAVPAHFERLFLALEDAVVQVRAPMAAVRPASFHPKVTAVRYRSEAGDVYYRLLVASRNLTFDRSWDTLLVLEGWLDEDRDAAIKRNMPIGAFVRALPSMALEPNEAAAEVCEMIASEIERVVFEPPAPFDEMRFLSVGLTANEPDVRQTIKRVFGDDPRSMLIVSPFVDPKFLARFKNVREFHLVSRAETLAKIAADPVANRRQAWVLDEACTVTGPEDAAESEPQAPNSEDAPNGPPPTGLHAKIFVLDEGRRSRVITGSANATMRAFGGNVEFMVELGGSTSKVGSQAILGTADGAVGMRAMLRPFAWDAVGEAADDAAMRAAEEAAEDVRRSIAMNRWVVDVSPAEAGGSRFNSRLTAREDVTYLPDVLVRVRLSSLGGESLRPVERGGREVADFGLHSLDAITAFLVFEVEARREGAVARLKFLVNAKLSGAPDDRAERLLASLIRDSRALLRFLRLMLADDPEDLGDQMMRMIDEPGDQGSSASAAEEGVLESMLRTLHRAPGRLQAVDRLFSDLMATEEGRAIMPEGIGRIWPAIREVLAARSRESEDRL